MAPTFLRVRPPAPLPALPRPAASLRPPRPFPGPGWPYPLLRGPGGPARGGGGGRPPPSFPKPAGEEAVLRSLTLFYSLYSLGSPKLS